MYTTFFGLRELPFSHANDLRFFYPTPAAHTVEERIKTALHEHPGLILLTGDPGTGKTTLVRRILGSLENNIRVISLPFSAARFDDVLSYLCGHFAVEPQGPDALTKVLAIQEHLRTWAQQGVTTVLHIDEAQQLLKETLDRLRLLLHLRGPTGKLLQILLVGQPWLETKLAHPDLCHLQQYVTAHCRLDALTQDDVRAFIEHRLQVAGCDRKDLFSPESIQRITQYSQAVPQLINVICDNSLLTAYMAGSHTVTRACVEEVAENLQLMSADPFLSAPQAQSPVPTDDEQLPVVIRPLPKREPSSNQGWTYNLAWASIGVFCAWLSSSPYNLLRFPLFAPWSSTAELPPSLAGTPALVATPPIPSRTSTIQSPDSQPSEAPLDRRQSSTPPSQIAQEKRDLIAPFSPGSSTMQNQPPLPAFSLTHSHTPTETSTRQHLSVVPTPVPVSTPSAPNLQPEGTKPTTKALDTTSSSRVASPIAPTEAQQTPPLTTERTRANDAKAQTVPRYKATEEAKTSSLQLRAASLPDTLFRATLTGNVREVERFLETRGPINAQDGRGWTALMIAAHDNQPDIVRMLLAHGAAVNSANKEGETALMYAADNNHLAIVQILLEHGAAIDKKSKLGWTALMYAAAKGYRLTVEALLDKGANPKVRDNDGQTASTYAMRQGTVSTLGTQLQDSSSLQTRFNRIDAEKREWQKRHEYKEIASLLKQAEMK